MRYVVVESNLPVKISTFFRSMLSYFLDDIYYIDTDNIYTITVKPDEKINQFNIYYDREMLYVKLSDKIKLFDILKYSRTIFINSLKNEEVFLVKDNPLDNKDFENCLHFINNYYKLKFEKKDKNVVDNFYMRDKLGFYKYFYYLRTNVLFLDDVEEDWKFRKWKNLVDKISIGRIMKMSDLGLYTILSGYQIMFYFLEEDAFEDKEVKIERLMKVLERIDKTITFKIYLLYDGNIEINQKFSNILTQKINLKKYITKKQIDVILNKNTNELNFLKILEDENVLCRN
jgi:hypothetical protein